MKAPVIHVIVRRQRGLPDQLVAWAFDFAEAEDAARRLDGGDEFGPHVVEEVPALGSLT